MHDDKPHWLLFFIAIAQGKSAIGVKNCLTQQLGLQLGDLLFAELFTLQQALGDGRKTQTPTGVTARRHNRCGHLAQARDRGQHTLIVAQR